jgi:carboxyl-terminal processing protease
MPEAQLSRELRAAILTELSKVVTKRFYDSRMGGVDWTSAVAKHRDAIIEAQTAEAFESEVSKLLAELKSSHVGFFYQHVVRASARMAISATYTSIPFEGEDHWVFQVIHDGGPGAKAGLRPGDILLSVNDRQFRPPEHPIFPLATTCALNVMTDGLRPATRELTIPSPVRKKFQLPYVQPRLVTTRRLRNDIGYIGISMFPGLVGVDVANEISMAVRQLNPVHRLIIDLRGNSGGGLAVVRVMSLLTPERLPIGYSLHRCQAGMSPDRDDFPIFDRVPANKKALHWLKVKFGWRFVALYFNLRVKPVLLRTEGLESQPFRGRVVLLVDRHTASASEMIAAFAREHQLAPMVGEPTAGRLLNGDDFKLPGEYRVVLPVGAYHTARGWVLEGNPILPDVDVPFDPAAARAGKDPQLERAVEIVASL